MVKAPYLQITIAILLGIISSCSKHEVCRGDYSRIDDTGISITTYDTIKTMNGRYRHTVTIEPVIQSTDIDINKGKKCRYKTLEAGIEVGDKIDTNSLYVTCNRNLYWYHNRAIYAGENLLDIDVFEYPFDNWGELFASRNIEIDTDTVEKGMHTFYVRCSTKDGKEFSDSVSTYYY